MTDEKQTAIIPDETSEEPTMSGKSGSRGVIFIILSSLALIVIPVTIIAAIVISVLLQPSFYTGILKNGRFITAFVQARNWQTEKKVSEEIEKELHLSSFIRELEGKKSRFDETKNTYDRISRDGEIESLNKQRSELKDLDWEKVKVEFPDKNKFDKNREDELSKIKERITAVEEYQDKNSDSIKAARKEMNKARDEYDDSLSTLEDKKKDADKITEKHKSSLSNTIYADLDIIEKPLTKILNSKLIDGVVRAEVEKALRFFTSYDTQIEHRNIFYQRDMETEGLGKLTLMVRLPELSISLWITDETTRRKQHILSELLAAEIGKMEDIQNRTMLTTMFKLSDSSLGEYFANSYLHELGMSIDGGVIRIAIPVLKGNTAENIALAMEFLLWGQYAAFAAGGLLLLFVAYLFFSTIERRRKLAMIKRLLIYPPVLVLTACGVFLWASRYIFSYYPDIISNLSARSYAKHLSFIAAWHFIVPMVIVFGAALICGLIIRKYFLTGK
jgi:hypothetical protein